MKFMQSKFILGAVALFLWLSPIGAYAEGQDLLERHEFFHVVIDGKPYRLEGFVAKRTDAAERLPIAIITHGQPGSLREIKAESIEKFVPRARDLAIRGWLAVIVVRRGFGKSDGPFVGTLNGTAEFERAFDAGADDLQAVIDTIKKRPDADASRIIAIGASAGGAIAVALGARNPPGLVGVISVSGGLRSFNSPWKERLAEAYRTYGAESHVPNLWLCEKRRLLCAGCGRAIEVRLPEWRGASAADRIRSA